MIEVKTLGSLRLMKETKFLKHFKTLKIAIWVKLRLLTVYWFPKI